MPARTRPCEAVVVRDGQDPIVVILDLRIQQPPARDRPGCRFTLTAEYSRKLGRLSSGPTLPLTPATLSFARD